MLPKDLAARAEKLAPEKVEAEVKRIVSAKPKSQVPATLGHWLRDPGAIIPTPNFQPMWEGASDLYQQQVALEEARRRQQRLMQQYQERIMRRF